LDAGKKGTAMETACADQYDAILELIAGKRYDEAIVALEALVAACDNHAAAHVDLGHLYGASGNVAQALAHFEQSVALEPDNPVYLKHLAELLFSECNAAERAVTLYERVLSLCPEDVQALMITGHLCVSLERFDDALGYYHRVLDIEPGNDQARRFADRLLAHGIGFASAKGPEAGYQWCKELMDRGEIQAAMAGLEALSIVFPDFALAHNDLGVLHYRQGDMARSVGRLKQAVSLAPDNATLKRNLADVYLADPEQIEQALEIYISILNDHPEDIDALMVAGDISAALGKTDSARTFYDRALCVEPWNMEVNDHLLQLTGDVA
jgi:tetratricopeptide (TPR) repeat protein